MVEIAPGNITKNMKSSIYMLKYSLLKPQARSYFRRVLREQHLSHDELEDLNWRRTLALLEYAYEKVPYYSARFRQAGIDPRELTRPDDYAHVPVLTRQDLKEHFPELVSTEFGPRDLRMVTTGGSTGQPVKVYHQKNVVREAMRWRMLSWWGLSPGEDMASVYRDVGGSWKARLINNLAWWPSRKVLLDAANIQSASMERFLREFCRVRPRLLHGYVGAVDHLATYILEHSIRVPAPRAVWLTSAPLTEVQEQRIQQAFGAPAYDQYGSCEVYWLAAQCPRKCGLHMFHDVRRIEFLDEQNRPCADGELGKIAVTDLENFAFPLIRYLNGDMGRRLPEACSCGVTLPCMDKVRGRTTDLLKLPDGRVISGDYLTTIFDSTPDAVRQFQVHQKADYSVEVLVLPNPQYGQLDAVLSQVKVTLQQKVQSQVPVEVVKVNQIPQKGGKLRFVRSDVQ